MVRFKGGLMELTIIREEQLVELTLDVFRSTNSNTEGINREWLIRFQPLKQKMKEEWGSYCSVQDQTGSTISIKAAYGDLISEFVELDYNKSIAKIEDFTTSKLPESEDELVESMDKLKNAFEVFLLLHPFSLLIYADFKKVISFYPVYIMCYLNCDVLLKYSFKWRNNPENIIFPEISYLKEEARKLVNDYKNCLMEIKSVKQVTKILTDRKDELIRKINEYLKNLMNYAYDEITFCSERLNRLIYEYLIAREDYHKIINRIYNLEQKPDLNQFSVAHRLESWAESNDQTFLAKKIEYVHKIKRDDLGNVVLTEEYDVDLSDACFLVLKELVLSHTIIKRCENCNKTFKPQNRTDEKYCRRQFGQTQNTCHNIGPLRKSKNKESLNKYQRLYVLYRERYRSRVNRKTMNKQVYEKWKNDATKKRDQAKKKDISYSRFENWIIMEDQKFDSKRKDEKLSK